MNVIDSSAWLSYFADDNNAEIFAKEIENPIDLLIPSITIQKYLSVFSNNEVKNQL